ncbi:PucR family transcriptional regulator ligand-binding domain-containing protein [Parafrigoribacterium mesophilum]|uniref:PucR family transcriptional regulator n=1 Tax=Parafrigoribacterium mesophilum TaxID=433646 RepID=UPI0031FE0B0C
MADRLNSVAEKTDRTGTRNVWSVLPTVQDVLRLPVVIDALPEVLAGSDSLDSPVRWVHVSESLAVAKLLDGGELLLTTGAGWSTDDAELTRYIDDLVQVGVSGLVLELVQRYRTVPGAVLDACVRHGFPLIVVHREVKFVAITEAVHSGIISVQTGALRARDELRELFTDLSLRGSPADFIVKQLSQVLHSTVVLENLSHEVIAIEGEGLDAHEVLRHWEQKSRAAHRTADQAMVTGEDCADGWIVVPVEARGTRWGSLLALPGEPHPAGRAAVLVQGAIALALGRLADQDADEWLRLSHQRLLDMLLDGRYTNASSATARLESAGLPLAHRRTLIGLTIVGEEGASGSVAEAMTSAAASIGAHAVAGAVADWPATAELRSLHNAPLQLVVCLSLPADTPLGDRQLERLARQFAASAGISADKLTMGVGSKGSDVSGLLVSLHESIRLLEETSRPHRGLVIQHVADRPLLRLITALRDDPRVQEHAERMLRRLIDYDLDRNGDLLNVLAATLTHPTNRTAAAAASHLSRSVFYQRLALISNLLDVDLDDGETLASLQVAMFAR